MAARRGPSRSCTAAVWRTGSPAFAGDDECRMGACAPSNRVAFSRHDFARAFPNSLSLSRNRGRRECRVRAAPAVSCAKKLHIGAHEHTGERRTLRHPLRNGFTAYFVLSPVSGLVVTVTPAETCLKSLTPASRRQDHTTSPYALSFRPRSRMRLTQKRPPHPIPTLGDDGQRPSSGMGRATILLICRNEKRNIFAKGD